MGTGTEALSNQSVLAVPVTPSTPRSSRRYVYYVLGLLSTVYAISMVDRQLLAILLEPIKREFKLSDMAMGFLGGPAFAVFYTTFGLPLARLADRRSRSLIITASLAVWSVFTAVTGFARSVMHLLAARFGVAVGEAGCNPAAYSLLSDYFPVERRATAFAVYQLGAVVGTFVGMKLGGALAEIYGWRSVFLYLGVPGLAVALLVKLTLREPVRGALDVGTGAAARPALAVIGVLLAKPAFRHLATAAALHCFVVYGIGNFYGSFLIRSHGLSLPQASSKLAFIYLLAGVAGTYAGGWLADRNARRSGDARYYLWVPGVLLAVGFPFSQLAFWTSDLRLVLVGVAMTVATASGYLAPSVTATYRMVQSSERALASAVLLFILNMIGLGLGPLASGALSDLLHGVFVARGASEAQATADGLRWALCVMSGGSLWAAAHYFLAARRLRQDSLA